MRAWASVWLFPLGFVGGVVLISLSTVSGYVLAIAWGFVVFPHGAAYFWRHSRNRHGGRDQNGFDDADTDYWRTTFWDHSSSG